MGEKPGLIDFSVVIPTYRRNNQLEEALASVLQQSGVTLEIIVIDDCPDGSARDVVAALQDSRVEYQRNPNPTGGVPSVVRNLGWARARGQFVHFLDDDDIVPGGHYQVVKATFETHPEVGLVFGRIEPFGNCSEVQLRHERHYFNEAARIASVCGRLGTRLAFTSQMLFGHAMLVCSAGVVRRESVERIGGFDPGIRLFEDADFYARVMRECGAYYIDRVVLRYRIGSPSLMHSPTPAPAQLLQQTSGRRRMQRKYLKKRGLLEFCTLVIFARTVLRIV
jgi:glycosyltransferase involved in cell wall biosynthesis